MVVSREKLEDVIYQILKDKVDSLFGIQEQTNEDELVGMLLNPEKEGYSWSWAGLFAEVVEELYGRKVFAWPLAESWDLLLTEDDKFLDALSLTVSAPYLGFDELVNAVEELLKEAERKRILKKNKIKELNYL